MKITAVSAKIVGARGPGCQGPTRNWIFVRVETDKGISGLGEATTEWHEYAVKAMIERHMAPLIVGQDPSRITHIWQQLYRGFHFRGGIVATSAISGIEMALWDIAGKSFGQPVYKLLGGAVRDRVQLYARSDLGLATHEEELGVAMQEGYSAFKVGPGDYVEPYDDEKQVDVAISLMRSLREHGGNSLKLMLDCGHIFSLQAAHRLISEIVPLRPLFVEEPVNTDTPRAIVSLRRAFPNVRIAAGEVIATRWGFREWLEEDAMDVIQPDIAHCGGIGELMRIASGAEVYGVKVAPHNPYGPVSMAANLHACVAMPNFLILEHCRLQPWFDRLQIAGPNIEEGFSTPLDRPGLGVELDWEFASEHEFHPIPMRLRFDEDGGLFGQ